MNFLLADVPSSLSGRSAPSYEDLAVLPPQRAEADVVRDFLADPALTVQQREDVSAMATDLVEAARTGGGVGGMEGGVRGERQGAAERQVHGPPQHAVEHGPHEAEHKGRRPEGDRAAAAFSHGAGGGGAVTQQGGDRGDQHGRLELGRHGIYVKYADKNAAGRNGR